MVTSPTGTTADIAWQASTDNIGIAGYRIYRDSVQIADVTQSPLIDAGLTPGIEYCYAISAFDAAGNVSARSAEVCVTPFHKPPVAALIAPASGLIGDLLTFDASSSVASDGPMANYLFDFGDGSDVLSLSTPIAQHEYSSLGTFTISVTVTDSLSDQATATEQVTIGLLMGEPINISLTPFYSQTPSVSRAADGSIYVVWEERRDNIMFSRSIDGGASFDPARYVIDPAGPWGSGNDYSSAQMRVIVTSTDVHIAWTVFDLLFGGAEIFHLRSSDGGATFTDPVIVSTIDTYNSYGSSLAAEDDGTVFIAWTDDDIAAGPFRGISYARSTDKGDSFSLPTLLPNSADGLCPDVVGTSTPIYMTYTEFVPEPAQAVFVQSSDNAQSFSAPIVLDQIPEKSWCAKLARDSSGTIYVVWEEGAAFVDRKVMSSYSTDSGITFSAPVLLSTTNTDSDCSSIATGGDGRVYVAWSMTTGVELSDSFLAFSSDGGQTFSEPLRIAVAPPEQGFQGCFHIVAGEDDQIGLVWNTLDLGNNQAEIFYAGGQVSPP